MTVRRCLCLLLTLLLLPGAGCGPKPLPPVTGGYHVPPLLTTPRTQPPALAVPSQPVRNDDQIVVCGKRFHIGTPVVLWTEPGGFNAYPGRHFNDRVTRDEPNPHPPNFAQLQQMIDQFVIHYDAAGTSPLCFQTLEKRSLSVQFLLDIDGTIYQTMDLQHRAWHASIANSRSVGVEIAHVGAFRSAVDPQLRKWYVRDMFGPRLAPPPGKPYPTLRPARPYLIQGMIQHRLLRQYDYTDAQYEALARLAAALSRIFPKIELAWPGQDYVLSASQLAQWHGLLGHYHITAEKTDPGPAFDWRRVIQRARQLR